MPRIARSEAIQTERRRRRNTDVTKIGRDRLALPAEFTESGGPVDPAKWQARWVNDDGNRIHDLTVLDDYDVVKTQNPESKEEEAYRRPVGQKPDGSPLYAYLCRKPKEFFEEDQAAKVKAISEDEAAMLQKATPSPQDTRTPETAYVVPGSSVKQGYSP